MKVKKDSFTSKDIDKIKIALRKAGATPIPINSNIWVVISEKDYKRAKKLKII